jgi:hypothetical protein
MTTGSLYNPSSHSNEPNRKLDERGSEIIDADFTALFTLGFEHIWLVHQADHQCDSGKSDSQLFNPSNRLGISSSYCVFFSVVACVR